MEPEEEIGAKQHRGRTIAALVLAAIAGVALWFGALQWRDHLRLMTVQVEGTEILTADDVVKLAQLPPDAPLYGLDLTAIRNNVRRNSFVRDAAVTRDAPATLRIVIEERTPVALLALGDRGTMLSIDGDGVVLPQTGPALVHDLPVITGVDSDATVRVGEATRNIDILAALAIIRTAQDVGSDLSHLISEVRLRKGHDIVLYSSDSGVPIIFGRGDTAEKLLKLDAFWKRFVSQEGSGNLQYIDLRFNDQVVVGGTGRSS